MANYSNIALGKWADIQGKIFVGDQLGMTGAQASVQKLAPGEDAPFYHSHKTHEELYIIVRGEGEYQVDREIFKVSEGSLIRVAPAGVRALRNTGSEIMVMICVQYQANQFGAADDFMVDANIISDPVKW